MIIKIAPPPSQNKSMMALRLLIELCIVNVGRRKKIKELNTC